MRSAAAAVLFVVLAFLCGCAPERTIPVETWTFEGPDGSRADVVLPAHFDARLPRSNSHYVLRTQVTLPPELRERPLTLVVPRFEARVKLRVEGALAESLEGPDPPGYRTRGPHAWRIPSSATDGRVDLELAVEHTWTHSGWFDTVPRITPALDGGGAFLFQREFNDLTAAGALGLAAFAGYLYLVVYLTDRRRSNYGRFALTGLSGFLYPLYQSAVLEPYAGTFEALFAAVGVSSAVLAEIHFATAYFGARPPSRFWTYGWLASVLVTVATSDLFNADIGGAVTGGFAAPALVAEAVLFARLVRLRPRPPDLWLVLGGWPFLLIAATPDLVAWGGAGELLGGLRPACLGIAVVGLLQTAAMARAHTRSLRAADDLNEELRRQIAARSRELSVALARLRDEDGDRELRPGELIEGRYEVVRVLGAGSGGTVYLVRRRSDQREFAMKVVPGSDDAQVLARLAREAQLAAEVKHDHVIAIVDVDVSASGFLYIVMEYVPGATLRQHTERYGKVDWALPVLAQIADGLAAIHARGIVHRDLKPSNVLVLADPNGASPRVKISDFGIALAKHGVRVSDRPQSPDRRRRSTGRITVGGPATERLTETGVLMGTPLYMAPEAVDGARDATQAVDVFAFGVIAYEVLARHVPFRESPALTLGEGRSVPLPAPLTSECPSAPVEVARFIERCLSFSPEQRPTAKEAHELLARV